MWDLVGNPEDWFSHNEAKIIDSLKNTNEASNKYALCKNKKNINFSSENCLYYSLKIAHTRVIISGTSSKKSKWIFVPSTH